MKIKQVPISSFLEERGVKYKPDVANELGLPRIKKIDFSGNVHLVNNKKTRTGMILVKPGDLVISGINVEKGALAIYEGKSDALATIHYSSYLYDSKKIDLGYLKWFLQSKTFSDILKKQIKGGIKTELKPKKFLPLIVPLPDLPSQIEICKRLNSVADEITELQEIDNLILIEKLRQAILQEAVQGKLVPQDPHDEPASRLLEKIKAEKEKLIKEKKIRKEKPLGSPREEKPFKIPDTWQWAMIGEICSRMGSGSTPRGGKSVYKKKGIKFFRSQNVYNNGIKTDNVAYIDSETHKKMNNTAIYPNDILLNITGGSIGRCALVPEDFDEGNVSQHVSIIRLVKGLVNKYIHLIFLSPYFQDRIMQVQTGGNREGLAKKNMQYMLVPLPPLNEQKRIVEKVNQLMKLCDELESQVQESKKNSELLMQAVLRESFEVKVYDHN